MPICAAVFYHAYACFSSTFFILTVCLQESRLSMTFAEPPSFLGGRGTPPAQKQLTPAEEMRIYCGVMSDPGAAAEQEDKNMEIEQEPMRSSHPLEERPAKAQKGPNQGKAGSNGKGKGENKGDHKRRFEPGFNPNRNQPARRANPRNLETELRQMHSLLQSVCRLLLRHEDTLNLQALDTRHILFCNNNPDGTPARLWKVAKAWKDLREKGQATMALRQALAHALFSEVKNRIALAVQDESQKTQAIERGWLTPELAWNYLQWDNKEQKHFINEENDPIPHPEAIRLLDRLLFLISQPGVLHRFHARRNLMETGDAPVITWLWMLGFGFSWHTRPTIPCIA